MNNELGHAAGATMTPSEEAQQSEGSSLLSHWMKALKAYRLYQPGHRTLVGFVSEFHEQLLMRLSQHGDITLRVSQEQITWDGLTVYRNAVKEESICFRLFIQGVRELTFHPGIPQAEIDALLEVIHQAFDNKTSVDDLLSLLWEKDLSYIDFIVLDDFFEEGEQVEFDEFTQQTEANEHSAESVRDAESPLLERLIEERRSGGVDDALDPDIFRLKDDEVLELRRWVEEENSRDIYDDLPLVLREALQPDAGEDDAATLTALIQASFEVLAEQNRSAEIVGLLANLGAVSRDSRDPTIRNAVRAALSAMEPARIIRALARRFNTLTDEDQEVLADLMASHEGARMNDLVALLADPDLEGVVSYILQRFAKRHLDRLLPCLKSGDTTVVLSLMRILGNTGDPKMLGPIASLVKHADAAVRREAIRSAGTIGTKRAWLILSEFMADDDESTRLAVFRALEGVPPECYEPELLLLIRRRDFRQRSFFEKGELLLALARVPGRHIDELLISLLARKSLFRRDAQNEVRACAATALGRRDGPAAKEALKRFSGDRSPSVRTAVAQALCD